MVFSLKFLSWAVHDDDEERREVLAPAEIRIQGASKSLTVWRKSLILCCEGFTVIDSDGDLVYRVDSYAQHPEEIILMDGEGKSIFTMQRHKKPRLREGWNAYEGEVGSNHDHDNASTRSLKKPFCWVKKGITIFSGNQNVLAYVHKGSSRYVIEGSYALRSCKVVDEAKRIVAEVKPKDAIVGGVSFGVEVFLLVVQPGFDPGLAMALLVLLDQMFS